MVEHAMQFDADGDGKLSREELLKFATEITSRQMQGGMGRGRGQNQGNFGGPGGPGFGPPGGQGPRNGGRENPSGGEPERPRRPDAE